ncbi:hypothetical protein AVEN_118206-1 [Araneus ventricosus]|uniref:Mos1 transposase HTH domain-containing protein n=1 Tax=Araneus ventricosus TaxID=182803 RepID=A0A4Y2U5E1_ARAVE|nr:hypothetical protein AVEN_118206-1 [Araneus ventricosus]
MRVEYLQLLSSHRHHYGRSRPYLSPFVSRVVVVICELECLQSIENPAECEIRSVIPFHNSKVVKATETHRQISEVYGENIMSEGMVRKWVIAFKDGRRNVHYEQRSGRPSYITKDLVES